MPFKRRAIFTITTNQKIPWVTLLFSTVRRYDDVDLIIGLVDRPQSQPYPAACRIIPVEEIGLPNAKHFLFRYEPYNLCAAVKPFYFKYLFNMGYENLIYLDSDIAVFHSLDRYFTMLNDDFDIIATPHLLEPSAEGDQPHDLGILKHGLFNLGFLGVRNTPIGASLLAWWGQQLEFGCVTMVSEGVFGDQKYVDLLSIFSERFGIIRDPGANLAYWNGGRRLVKTSGDKWLVQDEPLYFAHFSGYDLARPKAFSGYSGKFQFDNDVGLQSLIDWYGDNLHRLGAHIYQPAPYAFGTFDSGSPITSELRETFRRSDFDPEEDPFSCVALEHGTIELKPRIPPVIGSKSELTAKHEHLLLALSELETKTLQANSLLQSNERLTEELAAKHEHLLLTLGKLDTSTDRTNALLQETERLRAKLALSVSRSFGGYFRSSNEVGMKGSIICPVCSSHYMTYLQDVRGRRSNQTFPQYFCMDCKSFANPSGYRESPEQKEMDFEFLLAHREQHEAILGQLALEIITRAPGVKTAAEIGFGIGLFMNALRNYGIKPYGFEVNPNCYKYASDVLNLDCECGLFDESHTTTYDLIAACMVFEHLENPRSLFQLMRDRLNRDGAIYLTVPFAHRSDWRYLWTATDDPGLVPPDIFYDNDVHITHFSVEGMKRMGISLGARDAEYWISKDVYHKSPGSYHGVLFRF